MTDEQQTPPPEPKPDSDRPSPKKFRISLTYVLLALIAIILLAMLVQDVRKKASYDEFLWAVNNNYVEWVRLGDDADDFVRARQEAFQGGDGDLGGAEEDDAQGGGVGHVRPVPGRAASFAS